MALLALITWHCHILSKLFKILLYFWHCSHSCKEYDPTRTTEYGGEGQGLGECGWDKCFRFSLSALHSCMGRNGRGLLPVTKLHQYLGMEMSNWYHLRSTNVEKNSAWVVLIVQRYCWFCCSNVEKILPRCIGWQSPPKWIYSPKYTLPKLSQESCPTYCYALHLLA